jgi:hypothetical protein
LLVYKGVSKSKILKNTVTSIIDVLSRKEINRIAKESGFVKLNSPLGGTQFLKLLMHNSEQNTNLSLNALCAMLSDVEDIEISKQGLDCRFSSKSIDFIKTILKVFMEKTLSESKERKGEDNTWMSLFERVLVKDGTRFCLPDKLKEQLKGFGGAGSGAGICVQYEFDLKTNSVIDLQDTSANVTDSKNATETKDNIKPGDLILRDLGYYKLDILKYINDTNAYFITKLNPQTTVYEIINDEFVKLNFEELKKRFDKLKCTQLEINVVIGTDAKIPVRMIIERVSDEIYNERIRKTNKENKKKGYKMRQEYKSRQYFSCFVTNIEKDKLSAQSIRRIYRLRWQVEIVFKTWKSVYKIHETQSMKYERWMTLFYARMLLIQIHWRIFSCAVSIKYKQSERLLSKLKCMKTLQIRASKITEMISQSKVKIQKNIDKLVEILLTKHDLEKRKNRDNQEEIFDIIYCISREKVLNLSIETQGDLFESTPEKQTKKVHKNAE